MKFLFLVIMEAKLAQFVKWMNLNEEVPGPTFATAIGEKSACALKQGTLPKGCPG